MPVMSSRRLLREADDMRRLATKVYNYRRDVLPADQVRNLEEATEEVDRIRSEKGSTPAELKQALERLQKVLTVTGGSFYPKRAWSENIEMFLVAAILAIGVRTFFIQPFKIPTNSMYPTYNGMTYELFSPGESAPGSVNKAFRFVTLGATRKVLEAPVSGEVVIPLFALKTGGFHVLSERKPGRKWFGVLPAVEDVYTILIGGKPVEFRVPADFAFTKVLMDRFGTPADSQLSRAPGGALLFHTGVQVNSGQTVVEFDVLTGDQLFVDRFSYHFRKPDVGEPFVFRTANIPGIEEVNRDKYYIKRLVGEEGDTLEVRDSTLYRNGEPIEGATAFDKNAKRDGEYEGYQAVYRLAPGQHYTIEPDHYFAMGDNSDESSDSRMWGAVPEKAVIGRAIFIYYPFSKRFGVAK